MSYTFHHETLDSDPEIEFISETAFNKNVRVKVTSSATSEPLTCSFCSQNLAMLDYPVRQEHYERHFRNESQGSSSVIATRPSDTPKSLSNKFAFSSDDRPSFLAKGKRKLNPQTWLKQTDGFWFRTQPTAPPPNFTPGLVPLLKKALWSTHSQGTTRRAALCYEGSVHISQEIWDKGWGCGYRNFLMACTALMDQQLQPMYFPLLDAPTPPGIRNLQAWIEEAWAAGFDKSGAKDLKRLVDTNKWIGTADLCVAFAFRGIPAELVDFNIEKEPRGFDIVSDWIVEYFSPKLAPIKSTNVHDALRGATPITVTDRMPLILQYDGHSRTVVGYEISKTGKVTLLIFDPSHVVDKVTRNAALLLHQSAPSPATIQSVATPNPNATSTSRSRPFRNPPSPTRPSTKRPRSASLNSAYKTDDDEVIIISDQPSRQPKTPQINLNPVEKAIASGANLNFQHILSQFKLDTKKLKKKKYQILYFPMTAPLTPKEKARKKVVTSENIC